MLEKSCAVSATHSCGSSAPIGCIALNPGTSRSTPAKCFSTCAMRGSVRYVARSGGGQGCITSHVIGTRLAGSCARSSGRMVVPVRGSPTMKSGCRMSCRSISGWRRKVWTIRRRFSSRRTQSARAIRRPSERGLVLEGVEQAPEALAEGTVAEVVETRAARRAGKEPRLVEAKDGKTDGTERPPRAIQQPEAERPARARCDHRVPIYGKPGQEGKRSRPHPGPPLLSSARCALTAGHGQNRAPKAWRDRGDPAQPPGG